MITTQDRQPATGAGSAAAVAHDLTFRSAPGAPSVRPAPRSWPSSRTVWILRGLCTVAFGISGYLAYTAYTESKVAGCGAGLFDCSHVLSSRWSTWFQIPVSFPAMGLYAVCLTALAMAGSENQTRRSVVWKIMTAAGIAAGLAAFWFICLQVMVIGHLCPWCLGAHSCGLIVAGIVLWQRPAGQQTTLLATLSVVGVGVLVGGQLAYEPPPVLEIEYFEPVDPDASGVTPPPGEQTGDDEVFAPPGSGDDDVFAPPGADDDGVFAPPGTDEDSGVFSPPGVEEDSGVFAPPDADLKDGETEFVPNGD